MFASQFFMHDLSALLASKVPIIVYFQVLSSPIVLFLGKFQARKYLLHVSLISPPQAYLETIMEIVPILRLIVFKHSAFEASLFAIPDFTCSFLFVDFHAYELMSVYSISDEFPMAKSAFYSFLFILNLLRYLQLPCGVYICENK